LTILPAGGGLIGGTLFHWLNDMAKPCFLARYPIR
jgi:hypothetical protein